MHIHKAGRDIGGTQIDYLTALWRKETVVNRDNSTAFYGYRLLLEEITLLRIE